MAKDGEQMAGLTVQRVEFFHALDGTSLMLRFTYVGGDVGLFALDAPMLPTMREAIDEAVEALAARREKRPKH